MTEVIGAPGAHDLDPIMRRVGFDVGKRLKHTKSIRLKDIRGAVSIGPDPTLSPLLRSKGYSFSGQSGRRPVAVARARSLGSAAVAAYEGSQLPPNADRSLRWQGVVAFHRRQC